MEEVPNLINISPREPIQVLNLHGFLKILRLSFKWYFWQKWKIPMLVLESHTKDRKSTRDKENIGNPKVNRGYPPLTTNRISADCLENSLWASMRFIPQGVYHTEGFNAM